MTVSTAVEASLDKRSWSARIQVPAYWLAGVRRAVAVLVQQVAAAGTGIPERSWNKDRPEVAVAGVVVIVMAATIAVADETDMVAAAVFPLAGMPA